MSDPLLTGLEGDYQVLNELYRSAGTITYLGRNLQLTRDVTITAIPAAARGGPGALMRIASDARLLVTLRHPNVVPLIEGRWRGRNAFVLVRARVRGTTLEEQIKQTGPVGLLRVRSTLEQVYTAIDWARTNGVAFRRVTPELLTFQQGSGRALVGFDAPPTGSPRPPAGAPPIYEDVRTIGRLARVMISGNLEAADNSTPLTELKPGVSERMALVADALAHGEWDDDNDIPTFLALLGETMGDAVQDPALKPTPLSSMAIPIVPDETPRRATGMQTIPAGVADVPPAPPPIAKASPIESDEASDDDDYDADDEDDERNEDGSPRRVTAPRKKVDPAKNASPAAHDTPAKATPAKKATATPAAPPPLVPSGPVVTQSFHRVVPPVATPSSVPPASSTPPSPLHPPVAIMQAVQIPPAQSVTASAASAPAAPPTSPPVVPPPAPPAPVAEPVAAIVAPPPEVVPPPQAEVPPTPVEAPPPPPPAPRAPMSNAHRDTPPRMSQALSAMDLQPRRAPPPLPPQPAPSAPPPPVASAPTPAPPPVAQTIPPNERRPGPVREQRPGPAGDQRPGPVAPQRSASVATPPTAVRPLESFPPEIIPPTPSRAAAVPRPRPVPKSRRGVMIGVVAAGILIGAAGSYMFLKQRGAADTASTNPPKPDSTALATGDVSAPKKGRGGAGRGGKAVTPPAAVPKEPAAPKPQTTAATPLSASDSAAAAGRDACRSSAADDQKKCFTDAVQRSDSSLNIVYESLIAALRRQARTANDAPDPPSVDSLRTTQRTWLDRRDRACQAVSAGMYSGRDRAFCFNDFASKRARELQQRLGTIPGGTL